MHAARQLAFVVICSLLPLALVTEAWASLPPPPPTVRVTMSRQTLSMQAYNGRTCSWSFPDCSVTVQGTSGALAAYLPYTCGDTRLLAYLVATSQRFNGTLAHVLGGADLYRLESGSWRLKRSAEIGRASIPVPITDLRVTSTIGSGNGSAAFAYRITAREL